jgi:AIPR protein
MIPAKEYPLAKQDIDAVESEYKKWLADRAADLDPEIDPFEFFAAEQFLKDFNLSDQDIATGVVGRSLDGGCDAMFFLLGGKFFNQDRPIPQERHVTVQLIFIQAKRHDGFSYKAVDAFEALTDDLLDIFRPPEKHRRVYHDKLLDKIRQFKSVYQQLTAPRIVLDYYYVTCLDVSEDEDCRKSAERIVDTAKSHFARAEVHPFNFINAAKFYTQLYERPAFEKKLQCIDYMDCTEGYTCIARLSDFYNFIKGDKGELIERMFDDNVRGFQLDTRVNESILASLRHPKEKPEFWLLNNGITVLSPETEMLGGKLLRICDPQIVNGLQSSRQIFDYYKAGEDVPVPDTRRIIVRVIQNKDEKTREEIIRATNNQNPMPAEALYTTFRVHKQLESFIEDQGFFYERRKGYWRDKRKPIAKIITALSLVQAVVAIILERPDVAKGRPRDYINDKDKRYKIFGHDDYDDSKTMPKEVEQLRPFDLDVYLKCWRIIKRIDKFLSNPTLRIDNEAKRNIVYYLSRCVACASVRSAYCMPGAIKQIDIGALSDDFIRPSFSYVKSMYTRFGANDEAGKNPKMAEAINRWLLKKYSPPNKARKAAH